MGKRLPYLKLLTPVLFGGILLFGILVICIGVGIYNREQRYIKEYTRARMESLVRALEVRTGSVESALLTASHTYDTQPEDTNLIYSHLETLARDNTFINNAALDIWDESEDDDPEAYSITYFAAHDPDSGIVHGYKKVYNRIVSANEMDCYLKARTSGRACWSQPYDDTEFTKQHLVTCYQHCGCSGLMMSADVEMTSLLQDIDSLQFYDNSRLYIVAESGTTYTLSDSKDRGLWLLEPGERLGTKDCITIACHSDDLGIDIINEVPKDELQNLLRKWAFLVLAIFIVGLVALAAMVHRTFRRSQEKLTESLRKSALEERALGKIENELAIAAGIQTRMLSSPGKGVHLVPGTGLPADVMSVLIPAREVGGDLYEYRLEGHNLVMCVADVSGKGIPASVIMTKCCTLFHAYISDNRNPDPAGMLRYMNAELCRRNADVMFVTMWAGVLDLRDGTLRYSSAGHNPPVLLSDGSSLLKSHGGMPLGMFEDAGYLTATHKFKAGDALLLYTDGITEAEGPGKALFGDEALLDACRGAVSHNPQVICDTVLRAVKAHASGCTQSDDITLLCLAWGGKFAQLRGIDDVSALHTLAEECGGNYRTALALEEAAANAFSHGGAQFVSVEFSEGSYTLIYDGDDFDPTTFSEPEDCDDALSIGGRGIDLIKRLCSELSFRRDGVYNRMEMTIGSLQGAQQSGLGAVQDKHVDDVAGLVD